MNSKLLDFLLGYEKSDEEFKKSNIVAAERRFSDKIISGVGNYYSKRILESPISKFLSRIRSAVAFASIKSFGALLVTFGLMTLLINFAEYYFMSLPTSPATQLIIGAAFTLVGLPLVFIDTPLSDAVQKWRVASFILFDTLCLRKSDAKDREAKNELTLIPIMLGIVFAFFGYLFSLTAVIVPIFSLAFITLAISSPEFALMFSVLILPIIPLFPHSTLLVSFLVLTIAVSFLGKVVLGKRLLHIEQYDALLLLFMLFVFISGVFNKGIVSFEKSVGLIVIALIYTLVSNIIVNRRIADAFVRIMIFSSVPTAVYGIIMYFIAPAHKEWFDPVFAEEISKRAFSTFTNPNIYAVYLLVATIFSFAFMIDRAHKNGMLLYVPAFILNTVCLVLTWSRGAWIAIVISAAAFAIIRSRRAPKILLIPAILIPTSLLFIPANVMNRILSVFNLEDTSIASRFSIWRSSLRMFFDNIFIGVGVGEEAFSEEFLKYAEDSVTAPHSHNLFLEIGCEIGIFALLLFALLLLLRVRHRASYAKYVRNSSVDNLCTTSGTAFFALLIFGLTDYIWYSSSMYFLFFAVFGLGSATLRISKSEYDDSALYVYEEPDETSGEINITITN